MNVLQGRPSPYVYEVKHSIGTRLHPQRRNRQLVDCRQYSEKKLSKFEAQFHYWIPNVDPSRWFNLYCLPVLPYGFCLTNNELDIILPSKTN